MSTTNEEIDDTALALPEWRTIARIAEDDDVTAAIVLTIELWCDRACIGFDRERFEVDTRYLPTVDQEYRLGLLRRRMRALLPWHVPVRRAPRAEGSREHVTYVSFHKLYPSGFITERWN